MPTVAATTLLDRAGPKRADAAWIAAHRAAESGRYMIFCDLKPVIVSGADRTSASLRWLSRAEVRQLTLQEAEALFLGLDRQTQEIFTFAQHSAERGGLTVGKTGHA